MTGHRLHLGRVLAAMTLALFAAGAAQAQPPAAAQAPGEKAYQAYCAGCHNGGQADAPLTAALRNLSRANVKYTLELGYMKEIAHNVPRADIQSIIDWLPLNAEDTGAWMKKTQCIGPRAVVNLDKAALTQRRIERR